MSFKNKLLTILKVFLFIVLYQINFVSANKYEINNIYNDLSELEHYATEYKERFPEENMTINQLVLDYIRNDIYDESLGYNFSKNLDFTNYINEITNNYNYLQYIEIINTPLGKINFGLLISSINYIKDNDDIDWHWDYLICEQILKHEINEKDFEKAVLLNREKLNEIDINTVIDAFNIYNNLSNKSISSMLESYYNKYTAQKRLNSFTNEIFEIYKITKDDTRDVIYNRFINKNKVSKLLENSGLTLFRDEFKIKTICYAFADYIYDNHPASIKEEIIPVILSNKIISNIPDKIYLGDLIDIDIQILPKDVSNRDYKILTDNDNIIIKNNKISAIKVGKTKITIESDDKAVEKILTIEVIQKNITLKTSSYNYLLNVGDSQRLEYLLEGSNIENIIFKSLNEEIVDVDEYGIVKAIEPGETKVIASLKDYVDISLTWDIRVNDINDINESYVIENKTNSNVYDFIVLNKKDIYNLKIKSYSENKKSELIFESNAPSIATVDEKGLIKAINSGKTIISLIRKSDLKVFDTCEVLVLYDIVNIKPFENNIKHDLIEGNTYSLPFNTFPEEVDLKTIEYIFYDNEKDIEITNNSIYYDLDEHNIVVFAPGNYRLDFYNSNTSKTVGTCFIIVTDSTNSEIINESEESNNVFYTLFKVLFFVIIILAISLTICLIAYVYFYKKEKREKKDLNKSNDLEIKKEEKIIDVESFIENFRVDVSDFFEEIIDKKD